MRNVYIINPKAGKHDHTVQFMERIRAVHATHGEEPVSYTHLAGNGRLVRNLVEDASLNQSRRLTGGDGTRLTEAELAALLSEDFDLSEG